MSWLMDLLKDIPLSAVVKERLALKEDQYNKLEAENVRLRHENERLQKQLASYAGSEAFVSDSGVLWQRKASGGFEEIAYCPKCKLAMASFPPGADEMLVCSICNFTAPFRPSGLKNILSKLGQP